MQRTPYDPIKDFSAITLATSSPCLVVVHPAVPAKNPLELLAHARARPGKLTFGSSASTGQLVVELFRQLNSADVLHVAYKGAQFAMTDLMAGYIDVSVASIAAVARVAVTSQARDAGRAWRLDAEGGAAGAAGAGLAGSLRARPTAARHPARVARKVLRVVGVWLTVGSATGRLKTWMRVREGCDVWLVQQKFSPAGGALARRTSPSGDANSMLARVSRCRSADNSTI